MPLDSFLILLHKQLSLEKGEFASNKQKITSEEKDWVDQAIASVKSCDGESEITSYLATTVGELKGFKPEQVNILLNELAKEILIHKFDSFGGINEHEIVIVLAAKKSTKPYTFSIFSITKADIPELSTQIQNLITKPTKQDIIKFQITHSSKGHFIFG